MLLFLLELFFFRPFKKEGGIAAFSLVFLTFLLLLSLLPLTFEEALGLLARISLGFGFSEESLESEELLTCFLDGFYYTFLSFLTSFYTGFFWTASEEEDESESEEDDSTFFVAFYFWKKIRIK